MHHIHLEGELQVQEGLSKLLLCTVAITASAAIPIVNSQQNSNQLKRTLALIVRLEPYGHVFPQQQVWWDG